MLFSAKPHSSESTWPTLSSLSLGLEMAEQVCAILVTAFLDVCAGIWLDLISLRMLLVFGEIFVGLDFSTTQDMDAQRTCATRTLSAALRPAGWHIIPNANNAAIIFV